MQNIFIDVLPPWVETGLQPAFYDLESGTVLQQTARMYAKVRELGVAFNTFAENVTNEINTFESNVNDEIEQFEHDTTETVNEYIEKFNQLHDYVEDYFENLDVQEEINHKLDEMVEDGTFDTLLANYLVICGGNAKELGCAGDGVTDDTSAINTAIGTLESAGINKLVFPAGEYVISGAISVPSNFELVGMKDSVLKYVGDGTSGNLIEIIGDDADNPIENVTLTNISIDGTSQVYKGGHDMTTPAVTDTDPMYKGLVCVQVTFGKNIKIQDCNFNDVYGDGIKLGSSFDCNISNNYLRDVSSGNIKSGGQTGYDNHGDAIVAFRSFNVIFENNTIVNTRVYQSGDGMSSAIGKPCGRSGLEFEYPTNMDYENNDPDDVNHNAPDYNLIPTTTVGDKDYRYEYGNIMSGNYVYGYTKGIHIESEVKCRLVNNTILKCHIGIMYSCDSGGIIAENYFNTFNVGAAPQGGYDSYYGGVAVATFAGQTDKRYGTEVVNNVFEGAGHGVTINCHNTTVSNNTFRSQYGIYCLLSGMTGLVVSGNTFNDENAENANAMIYMYQAKGAVIESNSFYSKDGRTLNINGENIVISGNQYEKVSIDQTAGKTISVVNNIFKGINTTTSFALKLQGAKQCKVSGNVFIMDTATFDDCNAIKTSGNVEHSLFENNKFYISDTRGNKKVIESDNVYYCTYRDNICVGGTDSIRFISLYNIRQCIFEGNQVTNDLGAVIDTSSFHGWNRVEKNVGAIKSAGYYPNDSLSELVNLYYNKSEKLYKFNINSSSTSLGWVCVSGGYYVTEAWVTSTSYTANKLLKNSSDKVYKCISAGSGASTTEPTQTSGTQQEADGYTWKYLGAVAEMKALSL